MTTAVDDFLLHYGKKGMKWGVRKDPISASGFRGTGIVRVQGKLNKEEGSTLASLVANSHIYSEKIAPKVQTDLTKINAKYAGKNLEDDKVYSRYRQETRAMYEKYLNSELPEGLSGKILSHPNLDYPGYVVIGNKAGVAQELKFSKQNGMTHADAEVVRFRLIENKNEAGFIVAMHYVNNVEHSDVENFLAHYGVRGMKWGVRRKSSSGSASSTPSNGKPPWQSAPTKKLATAKVSSTMRKGKKQKVLSPDAQEMRDIRLKVKREGIQSLTNKDLEVINRRMELQQKYNKNFPKKKSPYGAAADMVIDTILSDAGEKHILEFLAPRSPNAAVAVRNAILINRTVRNVKK